MDSHTTIKAVGNKPKRVAERKVQMPGLAEAIFLAFVQTDHYRGLRIVADRMDISVGEAERIVQAGLREMLANGSKPPRFRDGFGRETRPMGKATVIKMQPRVNLGEAA